MHILAVYLTHCGSGNVVYVYESCLLSIYLRVMSPLIVVVVLHISSVCDSLWCCSRHVLDGHVVDRRHDS